MPRTAALWPVDDGREQGIPDLGIRVGWARAEAISPARCLCRKCARLCYLPGGDAQQADAPERISTY